MKTENNNHLNNDQVSCLDLPLEDGAVLKTSLYLDDIRTPTKTLPGYNPWIVVRNFKEFAAYIVQNGIPDFISFDHDLHQEHYAPMEYWNGDYEYWAANQKFKNETGLDCVKWLLLWCESHPDAVINKTSIHSFNKVRATLMQSNINSYKQHRGWDADCYMATHPFKEEQ